MSTRRPRIAGERRRPAGPSDDLEPEVTVEPGESAGPADVSEAAEVTAPDAPPEEVSRPVRPPLSRRARIVLSVLAFLAVAAVAFALVAALTVRHVESDADAQVKAEDAAIGAASKALETMLAYRYQTVAADLEDAETLMTDSFAAEYAKLAPQVTSAAEQRKIDVTAVVRAIAPLECGQECSTTSVRLLAFVDQFRTLAGEPGSPAALSAVVRMEKKDGRWLVAEMTTT